MMDHYLELGFVV